MGVMSGFLLSSNDQYITEMDFASSQVTCEIGTTTKFADLNKLNLNPSDYTNIVSFTGWEGLASSVNPDTIYLNKAGRATIKAVAKSTRNTYISASFELVVTDDNTYAEGLSFTNSVLALSTNDIPNKAHNALNITGAAVSVLPEIDFDSRVIDYNYKTGSVVAVGAGKTTVNAKIKTAFNTYATASFTVVVSVTDFAREPNLLDMYVLKLDAEIFDYQRLADFDKAIYESSNEDVFVIEDGRLVPVGLGSAYLSASAVVSVDFSAGELGDYIVKTAEALVVVEQKVSSVILEICDSDFNVIPDLDGTVVLRSGTKSNGLEAVYYFKLTADVSTLFGSATLVGDDLELIDLMDATQIADDENAIYYAFKVLGNGGEQISLLLDDSCVNYLGIIASNQLELNIVSFVDSLVISPVAIHSSGTTEVYPTVSGYKLYIMSEDPDVVDFAAKEGVANACSLIWVNASSYAEIFVYSLNEDVVTVELGSDGIYYARGIFSGATSIVVVALDGSGVEAVLEFTVVRAECFSAGFVYAAANYNLEIEVGEEVSLVPIGVEPYYGIHNTTYEIINAAQGDAATISAEGLFSASASGVVVVRVSVNSALFEIYTIKVVNYGASIELDSTHEYLPIGGYVTLNYSVLGSGGSLASDQRIMLEIVDSEGIPTGENINLIGSIYTFSPVLGTITLANVSLAAGESIYLRLSSVGAEGVYSSVLCITGA